MVPLVMLAVGAVAAGNRFAIAALYALSLYFLLCLRLDHFREWSWDADMKQVCEVVSYFAELLPAGLGPRNLR